jgi:hypothetical protein
MQLFSYLGGWVLVSVELPEELVSLFLLFFCCFADFFLLDFVAAVSAALELPLFDALDPLFPLDPLAEPPQPAPDPPCGIAPIP